MDPSKLSSENLDAEMTHLCGAVAGALQMET